LARWSRDSEGIPWRIASFDVIDWGPGDEGIRAWRRAAVEWLNEHPGKRIPVGPHGEAGDQLDCFRESLRLMGAYASRS
jgi:hypothetical protein